jgi:hypothetical protein
MSNLQKPFESKQPSHINTPFKCAKCGKHNAAADKTCRNHCRFCLYSQHVDLKIPGDRKSTCGGMMEPVSIDYKAQKGYQIIQRCVICGQTGKNKAAEDDDPETISALMKRQNQTLPAQPERKSQNRTLPLTPKQKPGNNLPTAKNGISRTNSQKKHRR